ncbi:MAG TPA: GntR family transcriptional regulator [Tepidisphaeraceae bacterium]|jgi:GntR family transcriptional regulator
MSFDLSISPGSASPIFKQIVDQVRLALAAGRLSEGDPLPSVRAMAEKLLVNPNTVAKAYTELAGDGTIETQPGRGVFVGRRRQVYTKAERLRRLKPHVDALVTEGLLLGFSLEELIESVTVKAAELRPKKERVP